jgi:acyl-CoA synthetase (AMP-forming)/AMP-acid ligase II/thioesterase domain-containing protein
LTQSRERSDRGGSPIPCYTSHTCADKLTHVHWEHYSNRSFMNTAPATLVSLLRHRASHQPDQLAFRFLTDGELQETTLTHAALDTRAQAIGAWLNSIAAPGERALLLYPSDLEFVPAFFGCLYAGFTAVPAYPLDPARLQRTVSRLRTIIEDAQPVVALTTAASLRLIEELIPQHPDLKSIRWIASETIPQAPAADWRDPTVDPEQLAVLQYTSGSTTVPRGVMLSHRNVLENVHMLQTAFGYSDQCAYVGWVPLSHDLGLFGHVVLPLYAGGPSILMSPEAFLQKPVRWLRAISRHKNAATSAPNFAYELCVRRIPAEDREGLDLSNWHTADVGGEPIRSDTLDRFLAAFGPCGFRRETFVGGYGLAEATVLVSQSRNPRVLRVRPAELERNRIVEADSRDETPGHSFVSLGLAPPGQRLTIVDPDSHQSCGPGLVGEVWVSGANVGQGYWNRPAETERTFHAVLRDTGEGSFLRTGDLGFLHNGELFVTGRLKDLIILRGRNYYPQDFELTVETSHKALRPGCTAAFSVETETGERLVIVQELRDSNQTGLQEIIQTIRRAVFEEHEVAAHVVVLVHAGNIPKTSSGKLQRHACRSAYLAGTLNVIEQSTLEGALPDREKAAPRTPNEKKIAEIWSASLDVETIGIHDSFFDLGGDSLTALRCLTEICAALGLEQISPAIFLYAPTVAQMAEALSEPDRLSVQSAEVLPIQPHGAGVPLVLVAPGMECRSLARHLGADRPVLGIRVPSLEHTPSGQTIEQIAEACVGALRRHRSEGPYALAGWCGAGIVALEMARQLEQSGAQVSFVALFDAREILSPQGFLQRLTFLASRTARQGPQVLREAVMTRVTHARDAAGRSRNGLPPSHADAFDQALRGWRPTPWSGRMLHLWAAARPTGAQKLAWSRLSPRSEFHDVPGDHLSMLHEPNVATVATILASALDRVCS